MALRIVIGDVTIGIQAVSYTHLDVYKRQVYEYIRTGDKVGKVNIQTYRQNSPGDVSKLFTLLT